MKTIDQRIREAARKKIRVTITGRTRSTNGFEVVFPISTEAHHYLTVPTKAEALALLLTKARCFSVMDFAIRPARKEKL